uniref:Secreted protein n=1 Tax=Steinernema glaseri TaxID=37863 RepID=A0A1I7YX70_9BILA
MVIFGKEISSSHRTVATVFSLAVALEGFSSHSNRREIPSRSTIPLATYNFPATIELLHWKGPESHLSTAPRARSPAYAVHPKANDVTGALSHILQNLGKIMAGKA